MKNFRNIIKGLVLSISAMIVGFLAIALPFRLFSSIEGTQLRALFLFEIIIYFILSMLFLISKERKRIKKEKEQKKRIIRREKFQQAQIEYYDLAA